MKFITNKSLHYLAGVGILTLGNSQFASAGSVMFDFNDGLVPAGTSIHGSANIRPTGGVGDSGYLSLTDAVNAQMGGFYIGEFDGGAAVSGFDVSFNARIGGGTARPADGFSLSYGDGVTPQSSGEEGVNGELVFSFDTWDNNGSDDAPAISVFYGGVTIATQSMDGQREGGRAPVTPFINDPATGQAMNLLTGDEFANVNISMSNGLVDLSFKDVLIFDDLVLPSWTPESGNWLFGGRTGGANANHHIDNVSISTRTVPEGGSSLTLFALCILGFAVARRGRKSRQA